MRICDLSGPNVLHPHHRRGVSFAEDSSERRPAVPDLGLSVCPSVVLVRSKYDPRSLIGLSAHNYLAGIRHRDRRDSRLFPDTIPQFKGRSEKLSVPNGIRTTLNVSDAGMFARSPIDDIQNRML
jgi:hypothetical protein